MNTSEPELCDSLRVASLARSVSPGILVIGIGNEYRGDDAVGLEVARRIRVRCPKGVAVEEYSGDLTGLLDCWQSGDEVVLVDAVRSGAPPGTIVRFDALDGDLPGELTSPVSSHGMGVIDALALARALDRLPARLILYGIEGRAFEAGAHISAELADALDKTMQRIMLEISRRG